MVNGVMIRQERSSPAMQTGSFEITKVIHGVRMHTVNGVVILEMFVLKILMEL